MPLEEGKKITQTPKLQYFLTPFEIVCLVGNIFPIGNIYIYEKIFQNYLNSAFNVAEYILKYILKYISI